MHHHFDAHPDRAEIIAHLDRFLAAFAAEDYETAFILCPIYQNGRVRDSGDESFFADYLDHAAFQFFDDKEELKALDPASELSEDDLAYEDNDGEIMFNISLNGEVSDACIRMQFWTIDGKEVLCFENFDVM